MTHHDAVKACDHDGDELPQL